MHPNTLTQGEDPIARTLRTYAQNILAVLFGLLPIIFVPVPTVPYEYSKILVVVVGILAALVLFSLSKLRSGALSFSLSYPIIALWVVAGLMFVAALFSGDFRDSFLGDALSPHSAAFVLLIAIVVSLWIQLDATKTVIVRFYMLLAASTLVLVAYHLIRLLFGADTLSFGVFTSAVATPIGSWNDLALFLGLSVILSLVAIEQLPLTRMGRILFGIVVLSALLMLGIINFFMVWVVLGLTSLALIVYGLSKDRFSGPQPKLLPIRAMNAASLTLSLIVFAVSVLFIIGGSRLGAEIAGRTSISYIEVRPSFSATADIARSVYEERAFFGVGPNRFADAWRMHKDSAINTTIFWNTDFIAGNGYITSFFVTAGILGGLAWIIFLGLFFYAGMRLMLATQESDPLWYFIGTSSFVSAIYIWGMSLVYVPGAVILLIGALCIAITLTSYSVLKRPQAYTISIHANQRTGFLFTLFVIAIIVGSVSVFYGIGRHYFAAYVFNESMHAYDRGESAVVVEQKILGAFELYQSDIYMRRIAELNLVRLNALLGVQEPTIEQQTEFSNVIANGISAAQRAITIDPTESLNYAVLGNIFSILTTANIEGVHERAMSALSTAKDYNPKNPLRYLELAVTEGRVANYESARAYAETAIKLKSNYTDAIFYLSQLDIVTGNVEGAIRSTQSIIALEPQNPTRYYQLGVLEASRQNAADAIVAFERAIQLDPNYANARYLLALAYDASGRSVDARTQLERVLELNPGNEEVASLIRTINEQGSLGEVVSQIRDSRTVGEPQAVNQENGTVTTSRAPDSRLVAPVNVPPAPASPQEASSAANAESAPGLEIETN